MKLRFLLVVVLLCSSNSYSNSKNSISFPLTYDASGSESWVPYFMRDSEGKELGIVPEILQAIFKRANIQATPVNYPPKRTNAYIQQGILDMDLVNPDWIADEALRNSYIYSDKLFEVREYYMVKSSSNLDVEKFFAQAERTRADIGMVRGYFYHNQEKYNRVDFPSEKSLLEALGKNRVNVIICGDLPAKYWSNKVGIKPKHIKLHSQGYLRLRMRKELAVLLPILNDTIQQLHDEGVIEEIVNKYI